MGDTWSLHILHYLGHVKMLDADDSDLSLNTCNNFCSFVCLTALVFYILE